MRFVPFCIDLVFWPPSLPSLQTKQGTIDAVNLMYWMLDQVDGVPPENLEELLHKEFNETPISEVIEADPSEFPDKEKKTREEKRRGGEEEKERRHACMQHSSCACVCHHNFFFLCAAFLCAFSGVRHEPLLALCSP